MKEDANSLLPSDLLTLGKSLDQTIEGEIKGITLWYIDWQNPRNNTFHVTAEFEVVRTASHETGRPDIVCFVNGIPFVVIECKRREEKGVAGTDDAPEHPQLAGRRNPSALHPQSACAGLEQ